MDNISKYYPFIIDVLLVILVNTGAGILAAEAIGYAVFSPVSYEPPNKQRVSVSFGKNRKKQKTHNYLKAILVRNIFCSECDPISLEDINFNPNSKDEKNKEKQLASLEGAELIGTMVSDKPEWSLATIKITAPETNTILVGLHDKVGEAEVTEIKEKSVIFTQNGQEKILKLMEDASKSANYTAKKPKTVNRQNTRKNDLSSKIRKVGPYKYEVDKSVVQNFMKNIASAGRGAGIIPNPGGGFRVTFVRSYSIFYKLGIRSRDVIKSVNNIQLNSIDQTLALYPKLKTANHLTISVDRRGKIINMDYTIR